MCVHHGGAGGLYSKASMQRSEGNFAKSILLSAYLVVFIHLAILSAHLLKLENSPKSIVSVEVRGGGTVSNGLTGNCLA